MKGILAWSFWRGGAAQRYIILVNWKERGTMRRERKAEKGKEGGEEKEKEGEGKEKGKGKGEREGKEGSEENKIISV